MRTEFDEIIEVKSSSFATRARSRHLWSTTGAASLLALMMFGPLAFGAVEAWSTLVLRIGGAVVALCWIGACLWESALPTKADFRLYIPLACFAAIVLAQLIFGRTAYYEQTVQSAATCTVYAITFLTASTFFAVKPWSSRTLAVLAIFGFVYAACAIALHYSAPNQLFWWRIPSNGGAPFGGYVNRNHYAGFMEMAIPFPLVLSMRRNLDLHTRGLCAFLALFMGMSVVVSGSRAGALSVGLEVLLFIILCGKTKGTAQWAIFAIPVSAALAFWLGGSVLIDRIGTVSGSGLRLKILRDGLTMVAEKPFMGWGLGVFPTVYPQFRSFFTSEFVNQAHNDYLQLVIETGIAGFAAMGVFVTQVLRTAIAESDIWQENSFSALSIAAMIGILGLLVHSFADFNLQIPANALMFFTLCGIAVRRNPEFGS